MDARYGWKTQKIVPYMEQVWLAYCSDSSSADGYTPGDARGEGRLCLCVSICGRMQKPLKYYTAQFSISSLPWFWGCARKNPCAWLPAAGTALESL